jgi:hypothetical protein
MTEKSSSTVSSYSVHEDQLKWFDARRVAGGSVGYYTTIPPKQAQWFCVFSDSAPRTVKPRKHGDGIRKPPREMLWDGRRR